MKRKDQIDLLGGALLVTCSALMGINQVFVKIVNTGLHPVFQAGLRSACAFLPVLVYALVLKKQLSLRDGSFWPGVLAGVFFALEFLLLFIALDYTSVSRASIFFYTMPLWTAIAAHFVIPDEKLTVLKITGLLVALIGVVLALSNNPSPVSDRAIIGDLFCLLSAMFWTGIVIVVRKSKLSQSCPEMQLLYQLAVSAVILLAIAPIFGDLIRDLTPTIYVLFSVQVLVVVCVGFMIWFWVLSVDPASSRASFSCLAPVFGVIVGWLILHEHIDATIIIALLLVSLGLIMVNQKQGQ